MEKKQSIKVSLSTAILAIIVVALIGGIIYFVTQNNELKHKETQSQSEKQTLEGKIGELQNTINQISNIAKNTENTKESNTINTNIVKENTNKNAQTENSNKYKEITSELSADQIFYAEEVKKENGKFVLKGSIYEEPYIITADELKTYIKKGKITLSRPFPGAGVSEKEEYIIRKPNDDDYKEYHGGFGFPLVYVLCDEKDKDVALFCVYELSENKYSIIEIYDDMPTYRLVEQNRTITVEGNTKYIYSNGLGLDKITDKVANIISKRWSDGYGNRYYNFTFKNGKCTSINELDLWQ